MSSKTKKDTLYAEYEEFEEWKFDLPSYKHKTGSMKNCSSCGKKIKIRYDSDKVKCKCGARILVNEDIE